MAGRFYLETMKGIERSLSVYWEAFRVVNASRNIIVLHEALFKFAVGMGKNAFVTCMARACSSRSVLATLH